MGKTGTTVWAQVKGVKGQIRLVPKSEGNLKTPGPNQRFKAGVNIKKVNAMTKRQRVVAAEDGRQARGKTRRRSFRRVRAERVHSKPARPQAHAQGKGLRTGTQSQVRTVKLTSVPVQYGGSPDPLIFFAPDSDFLFRC